MQPRIETLPEKKLIGRHLPMNLTSDRTAELWRSFMPRRKEVANAVNNDLYSLQDYPPDYFNPFDPARIFEKWALVEVADFDQVPAGLEAFTLPGGLYAVFLHQGSSKDPSTFQYIFSTWLPASGYALDDRPHFEVLGERYRNADPDSEEEIWIPIREKSNLSPGYSMRKIVLDLAVTLDGFIEGPNGEIDWCIMDDDMDFEGFLTSIDTIFYGRVSYEAWGNFQPDANASETEQSIWAGVHSKKKYVFSSTPKQDLHATFITSDLAKTVADIRREDGKDIWLYGGAKLIETFINLGLIDRYRLSVHPTVLGTGKPLFENLKARINLKLIGMNRFRSGVVQLIYEHEK